MEEIGKLIHELFDELKTKNAELDSSNRWLGAENRRMVSTIASIAAIVKKNIVKHHEEHYMSSIWGEDFRELVALLGIELEEREENDETV